MSVTACTDVTGFGLAGHALDLLSDGTALEIEVEKLPLLPGIKEMSEMGLILRERTGTRNTRDPKS